MSQKKEKNMPTVKKRHGSTEHLQALNQESNQLTRESLETAFIYLLEKKELAKISISELVSKAGVSRSAFYRNYHSKEQMLEEIFDRVIRRIFQEVASYSKKKPGQQAWVTLFQEVRKEAKILRIAFKYDFERKFTNAVSEFLSPSKKRPGRKPAPNANQLWSSAIVSMIAKWVSDGMKVSEDKLATFSRPFINRKKDDA